MSDRQPLGPEAVAAASAACSAAVGLAVRGVADFAAPLRPYLGDVTLIGSAHSFVRSFTADLAIYTRPVRSHPPGFLLGLWVLDWAHLKGSGWATGVVIVGAALTGLAAAVAFERRWLIAVAVLVPALLWPAPEPTALFVGVTALATALVVQAARWPGALIAGLLSAVALLLVYEAAIPLVIAVGLRLSRRRPDVAATATASCLGALLIARAAGFSWLAGAAAHW